LGTQGIIQAALAPRFKGGLMLITTHQIQSLQPANKAMNTFTNTTQNGMQCEQSNRNDTIRNIARTAYYIHLQSKIFSVLKRGEFVLK
jgi:hypothetical protein